MDFPRPISTEGPEINIPLLRKAVEWAEVEAAKPEAECAWYQPMFVEDAEFLGRTCGTCFCVAGYTIELMDGPGASMGRAADEGMWSERASELLGLTEVEACALFTPVNSITDVRTAAERIAARVGERL